MIRLNRTWFGRRLPGRGGGIVRNGPAGCPPPDRVEEDWQVVIANPDPLAVGPQMTTSMSPSSDSAGSLRHLLPELPRLSELVARRHAGQGLRPGDPRDASNSSGARRRTARGHGGLRDAGRDPHLDPAADASRGATSISTSSTASPTTWGKFGQGQAAAGVSMPSSALGPIERYKPDYSIEQVRRELAVQSGRLHDTPAGSLLQRGQADLDRYDAHGPWI